VIFAPDSITILKPRRIIFDIKFLIRHRAILDPNRLETLNREHMKRIASALLDRKGLKMQEEALQHVENFLDLPKGTLHHLGWTRIRYCKVLL